MSNAGWIEFKENFIISLRHVTSFHWDSYKSVEITLQGDIRFIREFDTPEEAEAYYQKVKQLLFLGGVG